MALAGNATTIKLGTNLIAGINSASFDAALDQLDITAFNEGERSYIAGLNGAQIPISGDYDPTDTNGQVALVNAWSNKTLLTGATAPELLFNGTAGFEADAYVASLTIASSVEGKATISITLQLTGTITVT